MLHGLARSLEERIEKLGLSGQRRIANPDSALGLGLIVGAFAGWLIGLL